MDIQAIEDQRVWLAACLQRSVRVRLTASAGGDQHRRRVTFISNERGQRVSPVDLPHC